MTPRARLAGRPATWLRVALPLLALVAFGVGGCVRDEIPFGTQLVDPLSLRPGEIASFAGTGVPGYNGDLVRNQARLYWPIDAYVNQDNGQVYVIDWNNHRIRREDQTTHQLVTIAGGEKLDDQTVNTLNHPTNINFFQDGTLLISSWHNHQIRYEPAPRTLAILYSVGEGFSDGTVARFGRLDLPTSIDWGADSTLYISDQGNFRIRYVPADSADAGGATVLDPSGNRIRLIPQKRWIYTLAGTGTQGFDGDDPKPALQALFNNPHGTGSYPGSRLKVSLDKRWLYFADTWNHRVRRIDLQDPNHTISTFAGSGPVPTSPVTDPIPGAYAGDGGPATQARLNQPTDVDVDTDGSVFICDSENSVIRRVAPDGTISTVAGNGVSGYGGDGGWALTARLNKPNGIALDRVRRLLYIADVYNHRIRVVRLAH